MTEDEKEQLVQYRIDRAKETVAEIEILIENELWNTAINRMYYACFYAVSALLVKNGIKAQSHAGVRQMFGLHFVKNEILHKQYGRFYTDLFDRRMTGDYDDFMDFNADDVMELQPLSIQFIEQIDKLLNKDK